MVLVTHIIIAISSLFYTTYAFLFPSEAKLKVSYGFIAATIGSGTVLVVTMPAHMVSACISGLSYLSLMMVGIFGMHYRLRSEKIRVRSHLDR